MKLVGYGDHMKNIEHVNGFDTRESKRELPLGIIKSDSHTFSPYIECFTEMQKLDNVHMIDARTAMAYVFLMKGTKKAYDFKTGKPALQIVTGKHSM